MKDLKAILIGLGAIILALGAMCLKCIGIGKAKAKNKTMKALLNQNKRAKEIDDEKLSTKEIKELI